MAANELLKPATWSWFGRFRLDRQIATILLKSFDGIYFLDFPREAVAQEGVITCPIRASYHDPHICYLLNLICFRRKFLILLDKAELSNLKLNQVGGFSCDVNDEGKVTRSSLYLNSLINEGQNFNLNIFPQGFKPLFDIDSNYKFKQEFLDLKPKSRFHKIWIYPVYWKIVSSLKSSKMMCFGTYGRRMELSDYQKDTSLIKSRLLDAKSCVDKALEKFQKRDIQWNCLVGEESPY